MKFLLLLIFCSAQAFAISCPPSTKAELDRTLTTFKAKRLIFFASWCSTCKEHIHTFNPATDILIAAFDEQSSAEKALTYLKIEGTCYTGVDIAEKYNVSFVPMMKTLH